MLVLTRSLGEEIVIDGCIRVMIVSVQGDRVRLGIEAPATTIVDRAEIHARRNEFNPPPAPSPSPSPSVSKGVAA